ncbi:protein pinocchio isoform X3 [Panulirus ornatus]|uniref:protein pinocchio isoform X3 n=1 Tax=Panulirus ornatus TaxID=150431 RepID=UPI003A8A1FA2
MGDILLYDEGVIFDVDDPDFNQSDERGNSTSRTGSSVLQHNLPTGCLHPAMSCGMVQTDNYFSSSWVSRSESSESLTRLDLMNHEYPAHVAEPMMTLEDLRSQFNSCYTCGVSWSDNHVSLDCRECGGYSLERPCPLCDGKCRNSWRRDISMSHSVGKAHWEGECGLSSEERPAVPSFLAEDVLVQGLEDLSTSS